MKPIDILLVILGVIVGTASICLVGLAIAQTTVDEWHTVDSVIIGWDASTFEDGSPIPAEDSVTYYIYTKLEDGSGVMLIGSTAMLSFTVPVPVDTKIFVGVSAQRTKPDGTQTDESDINWSDDPEGNQGGTFGLSNIRSAAAPGGLRKQ